MKPANPLNRILRTKLTLCCASLIFSCTVFSAGLPLLAQGDTNEEAQGPIGQDEVGDESEVNDEPDLPEHAVWRYGSVAESISMNGFQRITFSPNGKRMAIRNRMNLVSVLNAETGQVLFEFSSYEDRENVKHFDFSPDSKYLLTASEGNDEKITIWNIETGKRHLDLEADGIAAYFLSQSEIVVLRSREIVHFDVETGTRLRSQTWGENGDFPIAFSPDGQLVLAQRKVARLAYRTQIFDIAKRTTTILNSPKDLAKSAFFSKDANWVVVSYNRKKVASLWDVRNPLRARTDLNAHKDAVQSICVSPDNRFVATTGWDNDVFLWDILTGDQVGHFPGHAAHVNACAFSPHNFRLATGAAGRKDNSILLWDCKDSIFPDLDQPPNDAAFEELWVALSSAKSKRALAAVAEIVKNPRQYELELCNFLGVESAGASLEEVQEWIDQLSSPRFAVRIEAESNLKKARMRAEALLKKTLERNDIVLEVRYRIQRILTQPIERPKMAANQQRRFHRVIFALELIGDETAKQTLQNLANAHPHIDIARDAAHSLRRVEARELINANDSEAGEN